MATITNSDQPSQPDRKFIGTRGHRLPFLGHFVRHAVPTLATLGVLAALAYWGHRNDWTIPKFSALLGKESHEEEDWCAEHNVPESQCIECNSKLLPPAKDYGWCEEHGVAQCPLHHPDVAQSQSPVHITAADFERAARALTLMPRAENSSQCRLHLRRIQFASVDAVAKVGLEVNPVHEQPIIEALAANGEVVYDETRMAHLSCRVPGIAWRVERRVGERVAKGDVLALVDSAEVGRAKSEFLQALAQARLNQKILDRMRPLSRSGAIPDRKLMEAETANQEARIRLQTAQQALANLGFSLRADEFDGVEADEIARRIQFLGVPPTALPTSEGAPSTSNLIPIRSPLDGVVVARHVVEGEVVDAKTALFTVADTGYLWLALSVRQEDARYLAIGQSALFRSSDAKGEQEIRGVLSWISTAADEQTRTVKVRVELPNTDRHLKVHTFGTGRIVLREEPKAIVVPNEAVHWDGACYVVFVRDKNYLEPEAPKFFHVRCVRPGVKQGDMTEIIAGLLPGEMIATKNSVVLEAQLLKASLGPGCGCADGH